MRPWDKETMRSWVEEGWHIWDQENIIRISLSHETKRISSDSHDIHLVSYLLTLFTPAYHGLLVSWSHETMSVSWYSLGLMRQWDSLGILLVSLDIWCIILYYIILYYIILYCTRLYYIVLYYIILYGGVSYGYWPCPWRPPLPGVLGVACPRPVQ